MNETALGIARDLRGDACRLRSYADNLSVTNLGPAMQHAREAARLLDRAAREIEATTRQPVTR